MLSNKKATSLYGASGLVTLDPPHEPVTQREEPDSAERIAAGWVIVRDRDGECVAWSPNGPGWAPIGSGRMIRFYGQGDAERLLQALQLLAMGAGFSAFADCHVEAVIDAGRGR